MKRTIAALVVLALLTGTALGGLTITKKEYSIWGNLRVTRCRVLFDSAYVTGGESLTAANLGLTNVWLVLAAPDTVTAAGYHAGYDYDNSKLFVVGLEDTISVNPASLNCVFTSDDTSPDTVAVDIPATTTTLTFEEVDGTWSDLSAVRFRILAIGH